MTTTTGTTARPAPLLCRLHLRHHWKQVSTPDGSNRYLRCTRCGRDDPRVPEPARWTEGWLGDPDIPRRPEDWRS